MLRSRGEGREEFSCQTVNVLLNLTTAAVANATNKMAGSMGLN